jgi:myo-inositol-1(or 4)-monophosphatase
MIDDATIAFAHRLADTAGAIIRPYFRQAIAVDDKGAEKGGAAEGGFFDPVTEADKGAERAVRAVIERERPQDGILGEEYGERPGTSGRRWVLDPVDGTRAFINGRHEWGSLIALEEEGKPVLGLIDQPVLGERFVGANGKAFLGGAPIRVRGCARIADAVLCCTHPYAYFDAAEQAAFRRVSDAVRMSRFGGDCYVFAMLAMGFCDTIVESSFHRWDVAALIPLVEGAGGVITDWKGGDPSAGGQCVASGDARTHDAVLRLLAG